MYSRLGGIGSRQKGDVRAAAEVMVSAWMEMTQADVRMARVPQYLLLKKMETRQLARVRG